ncbi:MAG: hypothetical protein JWO19_2162 [Bryobacterales bacterium]|nr:hypothetical protein [Bryobacterales bacterium]
MLIISQSSWNISDYFVKKVANKPLLVLGALGSQKNSKLPASQFDMSSGPIRMMMKTKSAPVSEQRARILLSAWNSGDSGLLRETLTEDWISAGPAGWPLSGENEYERMEMLVTIADALRNWMRRGDAPAEDLQVSVQLLRHLAGCEPLSRAR